MHWHHAGGEVPKYWLETAEKQGMLEPVEPALVPRGAGRKWRKAPRA